jgi:hypothetical protein
LDEERLAPDALIVAHQDESFNAEGLFASKVAKRLGVDYKQVKPSKSFYSSKTYLDYLIMNEVAIPSLYLFIAQVFAYINPDKQAIWEGVALGNALNPPTSYNTFFTEDHLTCETLVWKAAFNIFGHSKAESMYETFRDLFQREKEKSSCERFDVFEFIIRNRMRNRTAINPFKVYANYLLPLTPGLSKTFWDLTGRIPYEIKGSRLYSQIYRCNFPKVRSIPFISGSKLHFKDSRGTDRWIASIIDWSEHSQTIKEMRKSLRKFITGSWSYWKPSEWIPITVSKVNHEHPDLHADEVQRIRQSLASPASAEVEKEKRQLLFYWQIWRWVMEGQLTLNNKDILLG